MIAKILRKSSSFSGIDYNEKRVKRGEAELLCKENFGSAESLLSGANAYKTFLEEWSSRNDKTKYPQLHVSISAKGKNMSKEELLEAGKEWLQEMGYGSNPYIIYFHNNTDNNHIHIITTRIDRQGKKINDSFEKERSLRIIDQISKTNRQEEIRQIIADRLKFSFSNKKQFYLLLEKTGCSAKETDDNNTIIQKAGKSITIKNDLILFCQKRYKKKLGKIEKNKLKAVVNKYSSSMGKEDFCSYMKTKFGYDFFFFGDQNNPYGYAMVDNKNRMVLQGKDIMPVKILWGNFNKTVGRAEYYNSLIRHLLEENPYSTREELNKKIYKSGGVLNKDSIKKRWRFGSKICDLDKELQDKISFNNKRKFILNKFRPCSLTELIWLNTRMGLNLTPDDINRTTKDQDTISYYSQWVREILKSENPKEEFEKNNFQIYTYMDEILFLNFNNKNNTGMFTGEQIGLSREDILSSLYSKDINIVNNDENQTISESEDYNSILDIVDFIIPDVEIGLEGEDPTKKKKRKKRNIMS